MKNKKMLAVLSTVFVIVLTFSGVESANASELSDNPPLTDKYVLSPTYTDPNGKKIDASEGLTVYSGSVELGSSKNAIQSFAATVFRFGSSYVSNNERLQYWYDGVAYASGKQDFRTPNSISLKRVVQACFKYTRNGADLIGWQCSNASLGPSFSPGSVVKKTVTDTLNPVAPRTIFRYSYKAV
ncbi:MAG: hypothetical protein LKI88_00010 [Bifidobacterium sp.]|jgi:hypothetical protein|nr:hypothetical protein [Bifidobacterium sp.]MCI1864319.1 hypothetical protein [Bifidobacterium sp.]